MYTLMRRACRNPVFCKSVSYLIAMSFSGGHTFINKSSHIRSNLDRI